MKRSKLIKVLSSTLIVGGGIITTLPIVTSCSLSDPTYPAPTSIEIWDGVTELETVVGVQRSAATSFKAKCNPINEADPHVT
jgi:hypothetical protein